MGDERTLLELNPSQLRNLRNWAAADLPHRALNLELRVRHEATAAEALEALGELIRAHEGLRSRLARDEAGRLVQEVLPPEAATSATRLAELVETAEHRDDAGDDWQPVPVPPGQGALKAVLFTRAAHVVAIKLTLSHVFVDALGAQVVARHLRQLLAGDVDPGFRAPRQAGAFARSPEDPVIMRNTEHWRKTLANAPRSCTYGAVRREKEELCQEAHEPLGPQEADGMEHACKELGISPHTAWVTAMSVVASRLSGSHRQVFKATFANRLWPADFRAVAQLAQPVFALIDGSEDDSVRERATKAARSLASAFQHGMYDANALLDWLNSETMFNGAAFQPAFEVNYLPALGHEEAGALRLPETEEVHLATTGVDPHSGKPELVLVIRHLPEPHLWLTARRPVIAHRDAPTVLRHCLAVIRALRDRPDAALSDLPVPAFPESGGLLRGHRSQVAIDLGMTRSLVESAPGVDACELDPVRGADGTVRIRARVRTAGQREPARLLAWLRAEQPWFAGSVIPDDLVI
ncbi:condensation domain-containing protein [Streptomyces sp. NPDC002809]|uniref:condensation domain-containing protein n=1 Tax=Streptomyces sp. NPDC002809 TaxID=3154433 RepID=UPI00333334B6